VKNPTQKAKRQQKTGKGIILPSDRNALCERLELLKASRSAGNTVVRNEIVAFVTNFCDKKFYPEKLTKSNE